MVGKLHPCLKIKDFTDKELFTPLVKTSNEVGLTSKNNIKD
jgi:hypothetical protein